MKHSLPNLAGLVVSGLVISVAAHASGIPTFDAGNLAARAAEHAETLAKYMEQIATLKQQLESSQRQLSALTGTRNLGDILNNPSIRKSLPSDVQSILKSSEGSLGSMESSVKRIRNEETLTGNYMQDRQAISQRIENLGLRSKALLEQSQQGMTMRLANLDQLQSQINLATDPKAISDLQARLQVEQANIAVDQIRADLLSRQLAAEKELAEQQAAKFTREASMSVNAIRAPLPSNLQ